MSTPSGASLDTIWALILAAGSGTRLADAGIGVRKQYLRMKGAPLFWHSARTLSRVPRVRGVVFVFPPEEADEMRAAVADLFSREDLGVQWTVAPGGARRQDSVRSGLAALPPECGGVLVHDSARPFASAVLIQRLLGELDAGWKGVVPAVRVTDTIKRVADAGDGEAVEQTLIRGELRAVQTPQAFRTAVLCEAHERAAAEGWTVTDDASMVERLGKVRVIPGEESNVKITTPADLHHIEEHRRVLPVTGWGYDVHRYGGERDFVLGGVPIPGGPGVTAHSDGDVLLHALTDAVLGTFGGGDIGGLFPDTDPAYSGASSAVLLKEVLGMAQRADVEIVNVDLTAICQVPKLAPHRDAVRRNVARLLELDERYVNFKATTEEKLGFTGEKKGIKAVACVSALRTT